MAASKRILIVDDEPNILTALRFLLEEEGLTVYQASNGQEALAVLNQHRPELVILDVMMPGMDGFETARHIRRDPRHMDVTIIFLTAKGTQQDRFNGYDSGGEIYLTKPFENQALLNTVNEIFEFS